MRITEPYFKSKTLNMEGNKRHPQFTLELDIKQTHFFVNARFYHAHLLHTGSSISGNDIKTRICQNSFKVEDR